MNLQLIYSTDPKYDDIKNAIALVFFFFILPLSVKLLGLSAVI